MHRIFTFTPPAGSSQQRGKTKKLYTARKMNSWLFLNLSHAENNLPMKWDRLTAMATVQLNAVIQTNHLEKCVFFVPLQRLRNLSSGELPKLPVVRQNMHWLITYASDFKRSRTEMVKATVISGWPLQLEAVTVPKGHYSGLGKQHILRNDCG